MVFGVGGGLLVKWKDELCWFWGFWVFSGGLFNVGGFVLVMFREKFRIFGGRKVLFFKFFNLYGKIGRNLFEFVS